MRIGKLLLCFPGYGPEHTQFAPILRVAETISQEHNVEGHVLMPDECSILLQPGPGGIFSGYELNEKLTPLTLHRLPACKGQLDRLGYERNPLLDLLRRLNADFIWIHAEFWSAVAGQIMWHYRLHRGPRIIASVQINHLRGKTPLLSPRWPFLSRTRLKQKLLWTRLDAVIACATQSKECARRIGLPDTVPVVVSYIPVFGPGEAENEDVIDPWPRDDHFTIGFAGKLSEQKGWKFLLSAVEQLPDRFKVFIAGDGEQREELASWLSRPRLRRRIHYAGLLPRVKLLAAYSLMDVFVLPSITTPHSVEQFGCTLAEAMACGVPVIGSDSGAIPETIGEAGLIVREGDPEALARAIIRISDDRDLRSRMIACGLERYESCYSCDSYARSVARLLHLLDVSAANTRVGL